MRCVWRVRLCREFRPAYHASSFRPAQHWYAPGIGSLEACLELSLFFVTGLTIIWLENQIVAFFSDPISDGFFSSFFFVSFLLLFFSFVTETDCILNVLRPQRGLAALH
mmetsp:Transcript_12876/g.34693  ORF Transcript_12876/g.34693 Transcript_12876/m.34693 type:complete len:109 (+) Transcript_12876:1548-1874(+)